MPKTENRRPTPAIRHATAALRQDALNSSDGALIGSEDELVARYSVSRPTLRQAAALVAQEQLLIIRRGVGGGYLARRPSSRATAHMAAIFLQSRGAGLEEIIRSVEPIRVELACEAAQAITPEGQCEIQAFLDDERGREDDESYYRSFLKGERQFGEIMGRISGNRVLSLFLDILYDLAATLTPDRDIYIGRPDRVAEYRARRNRLAEAIGCGDEELAYISARRCAELGTRWMMEDLAKTGIPVKLTRKSKQSPEPIAAAVGARGFKVRAKLDETLKAPTGRSARAKLVGS